MNEIVDKNFRNNVVEAVEELLLEMCNSAAYDRKDRRGGFFVMKLTPSNRPQYISNNPALLTVPIGELPIGTLKYANIATEKADRLIADFVKRGKEAVSSWQTRVENEKYAGAILCNMIVCDHYGPFAISFSGLPELADEALMLALAVRMQWMTSEAATRIAKISNNQYFRDCFARYWSE
ncbi:MAG: hypothetical protein WCT08_02495 [Patescibacteria group bacterium]|jgi:hypothetical protein